MVCSLLYVSKTLLAPVQAEAALADIVSVSMARNAGLGITGALVATGAYFAQVLEGSPEAVAEIMRSISADPRHMRVKIIRQAKEEDRRFSAWLTAYYSAPAFGDRYIAPFYAPLSRDSLAYLGLRLVTFMEDFVRLPA